MSELRVAVSGFGGLDSPEPGIGVAKSLKLGWTGPITIDALVYDDFATGAWTSTAVDRISLLPWLNRGDDAIFDRLMTFHAETPIDVILPCLETELPVYDRLSDRLRKSGIRVMVPSHSSLSSIEKPELAAFCHQHGIAMPRTSHVAQTKHVPLYADQLGYPLMIKGTIAGAERVENRDQASRVAARLNARWGGGVVLQKPVAGEEFVVAMVASTDGELLGSVAMKKVGVNGLGKAVVGSIVTDPVLEEVSQTIFSRLNWRGPLELEFVRVSSGQYLLIEINPRFPSWIELSHRAGRNLPVLWLEEIWSGRCKGAPRATEGAMYVRDIREVVIPYDQVEDLRRHCRVNGDHRPARLPKRNREPGGVTVAVTGISALDVVMPGTSVAEALKGFGPIRSVVGLGYSAYDTGAYRSDLFDTIFRLPEGDDPQALFDHIREMHESQRIDVLIPCLDVELPAFVDIADRLAQIGVRTLLPDAAALRSREKSNLAGLVADHGPLGFGVPQTIGADSFEALEHALTEVGLPAVVKGRDTGSAYVESVDDAAAVWSAWNGRGRGGVLVQRWIDGDEFAVAAVCDRLHRVVGDLAIKKIVQCGQGNTWGAVSVDLPGLCEALSTFLERLGWTGPVEAEFIREANSERFYLIEVNPRFPAWIAFSGGTGVSLPAKTIKAAMGEPCEYAASTSGFLYLRSCEDLPVGMGQFAALATTGVLKHA